MGWGRGWFLPSFRHVSLCLKLLMARIIINQIDYTNEFEGLENKKYIGFKLLNQKYISQNSPTNSPQVQVCDCVFGLNKLE